MKYLLALFISTFAQASFSPSTIISDPAGVNQADVNSSHELFTFLNSDSNVCKETGGNLASILAQLQTGISVTVPNPLPISVASLPLPAGAATSALQSSTITTLGSPFQAGGSIGNTAFGISGTLPAFAATPTFNLGTLNGAATNAELVTINSTLGTPFQAGGSIGNTSFAATQATAANLNATVVQSSGANLHVDVDSAPSTTVTGTVAATQSGTWSTRTQDGSGNAITSQTNGSQRALDVGVDVSGVQVDPRSIRALTSSDVVTAAQATAANLNATVVGPSGAALATSGNQTTGNTSLSTIATNTTNAATTTLQTTGNTSLSSIATNTSSTNTSVQALQVAQGSTTLGEKGSIDMGAVTASAPTYAAATTSPLSLNVSGGLRVDGSGVTQPISGSVGLSAGANTIGAVTQASGPWTNNITQIGGASLALGQAAATSSIPVVTQADLSPATQNITVQDTASTTTAYANGQNFITGTPTTNSAASFALSSYEAVEVQVTGTWTGTVQAEVSMDSGTTWFSRGVKQTGSSYVGSSYTANFEGGMNFAGMTNVRVRAIAAMTGTATVRVSLSVNPTSIIISNPLTLRDSVTQSIANTIKAASTAPLSTDTALVVVNRDAVSTLSPVNANTSLSARQTVTTTESNLAAPTNAVGVILECESVNVDNLRWGFSNSTATILSTTLGMLCEPGRDSGYLPISAGNYLHLIGVAAVGSDYADVMWVLSK
jgi:hypothetical protein